MGLAAEWLCFERLGFSQEVIHTIQGARAASIRSSYTTKWTKFKRCCAAQGLDRVACQLPCMLLFLQLLMDRVLAFSTVKTFTAAIFSC